jgi:hypothetical protein
VFADPINTNDLSGEYTWGFGGSLAESLNARGAELAQAYEAELRAEAERKAKEAAQEAAIWAAFETEGPEEEWEEEESEYEEAADHPGAKGQQEAHAPQPNQAEEGAVFFRALSGEDKNQAGDASSRSLIHRCEQEIGRKACMSYVGFFGWLKKQVKSGWRWLKKAAKSTWGGIRNSVVITYHKLGYGDLVCYQTGVPMRLRRYTMAVGVPLVMTVKPLGTMSVNICLRNRVLGSWRR